MGDEEIKKGIKGLLLESFAIRGSREIWRASKGMWSQEKVSKLFKKRLVILHYADGNDENDIAGDNGSLKKRWRVVFEEAIGFRL